MRRNARNQNIAIAPFGAVIRVLQAFERVHQ